MGEFKVTQATYIEPVLESQPQKTGRSQLQYTRIRPCQILFFLGLDSCLWFPDPRLLCICLLAYSSSLHAFLDMKLKSLEP